MGEWLEDPPPNQGLTPGGVYELRYGGKWWGFRTPDPETLRFVVGGRPDVVATDAWADWTGDGFVKVIVERGGTLGELLPMQVQVPVSDDPLEVNVGAFLNLAGGEVVAPLEAIRLVSDANPEQIGRAREAEEDFREDPGAGGLRDVTRETQERIRTVGTTAAVVAVVALALLVVLQARG
jgi:hypothetical protein